MSDSRSKLEALRAKRAQKSNVAATPLETQPTRSVDKLLPSIEASGTGLTGLTGLIGPTPEKKSIEASIDDGSNITELNSFSISCDRELSCNREISSEFSRLQESSRLQEIENELNSVRREKDEITIKFKALENEFQQHKIKIETDKSKNEASTNSKHTNDVINNFESQIEELNFTIETLVLDNEQLKIDLEIAEEKVIIMELAEKNRAPIETENKNRDNNIELERLSPQLLEIDSILSKLVSSFSNIQNNSQFQLTSTLNSTDYKKILCNLKSMSIEIVNYVECLKIKFDALDSNYQKEMEEKSERVDSSDLEQLLEKLTISNDEYVSKIKSLEATIQDMESNQV